MGGEVLRELYVEQFSRLRHTIAAAASSTQTAGGTEKEREAKKSLACEPPHLS